MLLLFCFFELYSRQRGRLRQLRAPSLLDSSSLVLLLLPPAPRQVGRDCSAFVCVVLVLVTVRFALWTIMAELCFSVDDYILDFFSNTAADKMRQLREPSLLDSSAVVLLVLLPASRQAGRDCSALCVLFSYLFLCALLCGRSWEAELSFRWMILFWIFSAIQQQTPQANATATGTVAAGQQRPRTPTTSAGTAPSR